MHLILMNIFLLNFIDYTVEITTLSSGWGLDRTVIVSCFFVIFRDYFFKKFEILKKKLRVNDSTYSSSITQMNQ